MSDLLLRLHFSQPLYLLLILLLPLFWLRWRVFPLAVVLWRCAVFSLLVASLAGPEQISEVASQAARVFAFDLSRSVPPAMRLWMERSAKESFAPSAGDRTYVFGGELKQVTERESWLRGELSSESIKPEQTNLENFFATLLSLRQGPRSVFLYTDGWENQGAVERLLPSLARFGIKVHPILPPERPKVANISVNRVLAPQRGTSGEGISLKVVVENFNAAEISGSLTLKRNGQPFKSAAMKVKPGSQILTYHTTLPEGPLTSFQAQFVPHDADSDLFAQDNQATTWVTVSAKEKVLLLNGQSHEGAHLEEILKRRGFEVTSLTADRALPAPVGYGIVVFNNVSREKLSSSYLAAVERHVASGNGFLMLGGEGSFGPGGYSQTPIESLLPVELKEPKKEERNRAVILVIDKSGSMGEENRLLFAKEAAKAVAVELKDRDLLGVLGFDIEAFEVVALGPVEKLRGTFNQQIDRLVPKGRTYLLPALLEAKRQLERQKATRKHVIILSDGETHGAQGEYIDLVRLMREELKITVSTVAIGGDADIRLMKRIAQYGGGFFHHTFDPATLPRIILQQIQEPKAEPLVERDFTPVAVRGSELLAGFALRSYPFLRGYIETEAKRGARLDLIIPREERRAPLLASWNYGKGKAVAFTTDLTGRWSKEWIKWGLLESFWERIFDWLRPPRESVPPHEVRLNVSDDKPVLDLFLYGEAKEAGLFRYSISGREEKSEGMLHRLAPGRYRAKLSLSLPGEYRIALIEERQGHRTSYPAVGYTLAFDPKAEIPRGSFNVPLLERLARHTGGEVNPDTGTEQNGAGVTRSSKPLKTYPLLLAVVLFLIEVIFRRFFHYL